jgi:hypothetical protein
MSVQICSSVSFDFASDGAVVAATLNSESADGGLAALDWRRGTSEAGRGLALGGVRAVAPAALVFAVGAAGFRAPDEPRAMFSTPSSPRNLACSRESRSSPINSSFIESWGMNV